MQALVVSPVHEFFARRDIDARPRRKIHGVGPTIERAIAQTFVAAASRVVASLQPEIYGFVAGSVVEPGGGSVAGCSLAPAAR